MTSAKITVQLDWVAEPEHGGLYQAHARGFFRDEGLDVTLLPGGPGAQVLPSVATGKVDIAQHDSSAVLLQQAEGLPFVQFAAVFQRVLLVPFQLVCEKTLQHKIVNTINSKPFFGFWRFFIVWI